MHRKFKEFFNASFFAVTKSELTNLKKSKIFLCIKHAVHVLQVRFAPPDSKLPKIKANKHTCLLRQKFMIFDRFFEGIFEDLVNIFLKFLEFPSTPQ